MILTDNSDDALLVPPGVHLSWVMLIYVSQHVNDTAIWMTRSHLKCVVFLCNGDNLYNRVYNVTCNRHLRSHSEAGLCNCRVPRGCLCL